MFSFIFSLLTLPMTLALWFMDTLPWLALPFFGAGFLSIVGYVVVVLVQNLYLDRIPVNLKSKYGAKWALVTGASSGIGKAITKKLLEQGINVAMAALPEQLLDDSHAELKKAFPKQEVRKIPVNLSGSDYLQTIANSTSDIDITLVFNNAGYIKTGLFFNVPLEQNLANYECNATACVKITHHFLAKMVANKSKGLLAFTSSSAGFVPNPLSAMYASTKAFMTMFALSVAPEVKHLGIDVVVVHPSPVNTNFFNNSGGLSALEAFKKLAGGPEVIADVLFNSAGRFVVRDQGLVSIIFRVILKAIDFNLFAELGARFAHLSGDSKKYWAAYNESKATKAE